MSGFASFSKRGGFLCGLFAACLLYLPAAEADTLYVNHYYSSDIYPNDFGDANPGDGVAEDWPGTGDASLRTAIEEANAHEGPDTIVFQGGGVVKPFTRPLPPLDDPTGGTTIIGNPGVRLEGDKVDFVPPNAAGPLIAAQHAVNSEGQLVPLDAVGWAPPSAVAPPSSRAALVVNNANDAGFGSLRGAILTAEILPGPDTITFSQSFVIQPVTELPPLVTGETTIDGSAGVTLRGDKLTAGAGLRLTGNGNILRNLTFVQFPDQGIVIDGAGNFVEACKIGTDGANLDLGNGTGILISATGAGNAIQGGNIISGNIGDGLIVEGLGNSISNNRIGLGESGQAIPNGQAGVTVEGSGNFIGVAGGNQFSENTGSGLVLGGSGNVVRNNVVNANGGAGVAVSGNINTLGAGNFIVNNAGDGIEIANGNSNRVVDNFIAGNEGNGVTVSSGGEGTGIFNTITQNTITLNDGLGIDLGDAANEDFQAPHTLALEPLSGTDVEVRGKSQPNATIELFADSEDEGEIYIDTTVADDGGTWAFTLNLSTFLEYNFTATATSGTGNTSEFSCPLRFGHNGSGLRIRSQENTVMDLAIGLFKDGAISIQTETASNNSIRGCTIENNTKEVGCSITDANENLLVNIEVRAGLTILYGASNNVIGGPLPGDRNAIINNGVKENFGNGVEIFGVGTNGNVLIGNVIGVDGANANHGVYIHGGASETRIGGTTPEERNIIAGNGTPGTLEEAGFGDGIRIEGPASIDNVVSGNYIGINQDSGGVPNIASGVVVTGGSTGNVIGGDEEGERNVISSNGTDFTGGVGVAIAGTASTLNKIIGNYIGTSADGSSDRGNWSAGVYIAAPFNVVGEPGAGNVISGNGYRGIAVSATDNVVIQANFIGTDKTGTRALPNSDSGIGLEDAPSNLVGGTGPGEGNLISGNIDDGIVIYEAFPSFPPSATGNRIEGNLIGTDVTGSFAIPNSFMGVFITRGATGNIVGGEAPGARNVISGNGVDGVRIARPGTEGNVVENNLIGPDASGFPLGNNNSGILIVEGAANNLIGGAAATARNIITSNRMYGVEVNGPNTIQNTIQANSIFRNDHEGIILNFTGNTDLEAPTLTGIFPVRGTAVADARVEIFVDTEDEGEIFLGAAPSDAAGDFAVNLELASYAGRHLTATATDVFGNTSAFSVPLELEPPVVTGHPVDLTVVEGEPWGMSITAAGTETILYQWQYSDGASPFVDMADSGAVSGSLTPQLQSSAAVIPDEGFYRCVITNGIGEASESASAFLRVIPLDTRSAAVNTLDDVTDGDVDSVPQLIARPGADGFISLREMILASNNMNGTNEILFDVSGLILLQSVLPAVQDLTGGTVIEGNGDVTIDGSQLTGARDGVTLTSGQNFLSGLNIVNFPQHGVALRGVDAAANIVRGCMIGGIDQGNAKRGIVIVDGAAANVIGGANVDDRNVISGNGIGGVLVIGAGTADNQIAGNYIGTDSTGRVAVGNGGPGIAVASSATDTIAGGPNIGERNVISGNSGAGILVSGAGTNGNEIQGNYIGVDVNGDPGLPNTSHGVSIADGAINNAVGGTNASERNLIAGNGGNGVTINGGATLLNPVRQNSIHSNVGAGIGLLNGGDANLPAPVLNGVNSVINTAPANATVDLFVDDAEEGRIFVASLVANAGGQFTVNTDLTPHAGMNLTATATLGGNTSEFSAPLPLDPPVVTSPPQDINRVEGEPFGFAVTVSGTEELMYQWQFAPSNGNFSDIAEGGNFSGTTTASLAGAAARLTDAGLYRCLVTNRIGEVVPSSPGALVVIAAATAEAAVSTLDDGADGNTSSIAHIIAYPGADEEISLREAILAANNSPGANTIRFDVEGAILPAVQLPALSDASGGTVIDGGGVVLLDGSNLGGSANGLVLSAANNAITGLTIIHFPGNGVRITGPGATGNSVLGCIIGSNGVVSRANGLDGVRIDSGAAGNLIGGPAGDDRNVLSGNAGNGVQIMGAGSNGNVISNNYLGTDATGLAALANGAAGVRISSGAAFNTVGGSEAARNVISANNGDGVRLAGAGTDNNVVSANLIGLDADSALPLGNTMSGVRITDGASSNMIGGETATAGNVITRNGEAGVHVSGAASTGNTIRHNVIANNDGLGIDLTDGANAGAVAPVIEELGSVGGQAAPGAIVEIFVNDEGEAEGEIFLDSVVADGAGEFFSSANLEVYLGQNLTATTTDGACNTSMFSAPIVVDLAPPVITLLGAEAVTLECGEDLYHEDGATAADDVDGDLTSEITITILRNGVEVPEVDTSAPATYFIHYDVVDSSGKPAETVERLVTVRDSVAPQIMALGDTNISLECRAVYNDAGAVASDTCAGDLTGQVVINNPVNTNATGVYTVEYNVTDPSGNPATTVTRTVTVIDTQAPIITLLGPATVIATVGTVYTDPGATAADSCDTALPPVTIDTSQLDMNTLGTYTVNYRVEDASGNADTAERIVQVVDNVRPVITLTGAALQLVECGQTFTDPGATATDNFDGDVTSRIEVTGSVDTETPGDYELRYNVADLAGNDAVTVVRTVRVEDTVRPVITLLGAALLEIECGEPYEDAGATASDGCEDDLTASIITNNTVDTNEAGSYTVTFNVSDGSGNAALEVRRTVRVLECPNTCAEDCVNAADTDLDGDGLNACIEECLHTSDESVDSDGDGMPDRYEFENDLNPTRNDSGEDNDHDTVLNLDEFLQNSNADDPNSPARTYFVSPDGVDGAKRGGINQPWRTIAFALTQIFSSSGNPARLVLREGVYNEDVVLLPGLALSGAVGEDAEILGTLFGANNSAVEYLQLTSEGGTDALLVMDDVIMRVAGVLFQGNSTRPGAGILTSGAGPAASVIEDCIFRELAVGVDIDGAVPTIRRCIFELLATAGIVLREGATPNGGALGSTGNGDTGWNTFRDLEGLAVINLTNELILMENNDWNTDDAREIDDAIGGPGGVDFVPFLAAGTGVTAAQVYVVAWDEEDQSALGGGTASLTGGGFSASAGGDGNGIYAFTAVPSGALRARIELRGYEEQTANIVADAGEKNTVFFVLQRVPKVAFLGCSPETAANGRAFKGDAVLLVVLFGALFVAHRLRPRRKQRP